MEENNNQQASSQESSDTLMKILCYLGILCLIPYLTVKNNEFIRFHAKQGMTLLVAQVIAWAISVVPVLGWVVGPMISLLLFVLAIMGIINVVNGKKVELPIIGAFAKNF